MSAKQVVRSKSATARIPVKEEVISATKKDSKLSAKKALAQSLAVMSLDRLVYDSPPPTPDIEQKLKYQN